jgi:HEAT repeat protein
MFRSLLIAGALLSAGPEGTAAQPVERPATADGCDSLPQCLARVRAADSRVLRGGNHIYRDIVRFGAPAVDALVPMLRDPDLNIRERAGYLLSQFPSIDPRHFPALVEAWRHGDTINHEGRGNGWLPRAIAATGTDEALRLLWADYQRDPEQGSNSQTFFPAWSMPAILDLAAHARSDDVRASAEDTLARFSNPAALAPLQRRLAAYPREPGNERRWEVSRLIMQIVRYGTAAQASGPAIIPYLDVAYDEDLRADAALALGQIGAQSSEIFR